MRARFIRPRTLFSVLSAVVLLSVAAAQAQDRPPPKPTEPTERQEKRPPPKPRVIDTRPKPPPAPVLLVSSDLDCTIELDGEVIAQLVKDIVKRIEIKPGEHLLQAFPLDVEGPAWKETLKAPDTGTVVATIELQSIVEDWEDAMKNMDRFAFGKMSIRDNESDLVWAKNVGPEMSWDQAKAFCRQQKADGLTGWRAPTLNEMSTLYFPDHDDPTQEPCRGDPQRTLFGKKKADIEVLPRMIFEPFEHNSVCTLWVQSGNAADRMSCSFLGEFSCALEKKKHTAGVLCVTTSTGPN